jgi:hypothetical protein
MYSIHTEPELPATSRIVNKLTSKCKELLKSRLRVYLPLGNQVYSLMQVQDDIEQTVEHDGQEYRVTVKYAVSFRGNDLGLDQFFCRMFKQMMKVNKFEQIGRNCFNPKRMVKVSNIEIWPGLFSSINKKDGGTLVNLELQYKCIREDNLYNLIK